MVGLAEALGERGILPVWVVLVLTIVVIPLFFAWHHVAMKWPANPDPLHDPGAGSKPLESDPDGSFSLRQQLKTDWQG
jgi:hypothetical protein